MHQLIQEIEQEYMAGKSFPKFRSGDTVTVWTHIIEENGKKRVQAYEGVVIARRNRGFHSSITVRKMSSGEGVERVFSLYSPTIERITVERRGRVRRAKLYYFRQLRGRKARIQEKISKE